MFLEYRKSIKSVFDSIAQLDNDLVLETVKNLVLDTTNNWRMKPFTDVENALNLLFLLAEAIPVFLEFFFQSLNLNHKFLEIT